MWSDNNRRLSFATMRVRKRVVWHRGITDITGIVTSQASQAS